MNPNRWTPPVSPALIVALAGLSVTAISARAQSAPKPDAATLAKYDTNKNGVIDPDEAAAMQAAKSGAASAEGGDVVTLSPFQVDVSKDKGYAAENTLAGSRIKTPLADLAASITVVTKQQMEDTAAVDINDVFKYEASTEGSSTYTPLILDRGTAKDAVAGYSFGNNGDATTNSQANRVRGLSSPDAAINNYSTNNRIPFDAYNAQAIEISRGPNSLLFGLGSPSGVVNTNYAQALLNRDTNQVQFRVDHNGGNRASVAFNRTIVKDKLAAYAALLYRNDQFERKPSSDRYRRQYGTLTFRPFKNTIIRGFAENYENDANRPNFITPRDQVTPWLQSGRPIYDPLTRLVTITDTGKTYGPYVTDTRSPGYVAPVFSPSTVTVTGMPIIGTNGLSALTIANGGITYPNPNFVPGIAFDDVARPLRRIDNGAVVDLFARQYQFYRPAQTNPETALPSATSLGFTAGDPRFLILDRLWSASANLPTPTFTENGKTYNLGNYNWAGVTNRAIYDWTKYNTLQTNFAKIRAANYNLEIEQQITDDFFVSAGWFRQRISQVDNYTINQLQGATLGIDTNKNMPDGRANPYVGLPFLYEGAGGGLDTFYTPQTDDNYRALATYKLDFTNKANWLRWLGKHNFVGTWQEQDRLGAVERWRMNFIGGEPDTTLRYTPNLTLTGQSLWSGTATMRHFYMASPGSPQATVTHSGGFYGNQGWDQPVASTIQVYNLAAGQYVNERIGEQTFFSDAGSFKNQREVKGYQGAIQSYLWGDRLITTLGWRHDSYRARRTTTGPITNTSNVQVEPALTQARLYLNNSTGLINRDLVMNRWNHWDKLDGNTKTLGAAFRPLKGWSAIHNLGGEGSIASEFLESLTFYYNESDNFNPPQTFQTDYFGNPLPKPQGEGKDVGVGFNLFNNKLVARINWYKTEYHNERTSAAATLLGRAAYSDTTTGLAWAGTVQRIRKAVAAGRTLNPNTADPQSIFAQSNWNTDAVWNVNNETDQRAMYDLIKLPYQYYAGVSVGGTQQSQSKGVELQLTYNPTPNVRLKFTGSKDEATYANIAPEYDAWIATRLPVWTSLGVTDIPDFTDPNNGRRFSLRNFWTGYGFTNVAQIENTDGNTSPQAYFNNVVVSQVALAKALEGAVSPQQRVYHASLLGTYTFPSDMFGGRAKGWSVGGSERWESKSAIGYFGKVGDPTQPTTYNLADINRPIYGDNGNYYTDLWVTYSRKIFHNKIGLRVQLNCNNAFESGRLVPFAVNFDGKPWAFRIIDPRQWILQATLTF